MILVVRGQQKTVRKPPLGGFWQAKGCPEASDRVMGDQILWYRQDQVKTKLLYGHPQSHLTSAFWKALGTYWHFEQTITNINRIEKPLTRWNKTLELYIVIQSCGTDEPKWRKDVILWHRQAQVQSSYLIDTFGKSIWQPTFGFWKALGTYCLLTLWANYSKQ